MFCQRDLWPAHDNLLIVFLDGSVIGREYRRQLLFGARTLMQQEIPDDDRLIQVGHRHAVLQEIDQLSTGHVVNLAR
jgi:hypothetical protein